MPIFRITQQDLKAVPQTNFAAEGLKEREHLGKPLRDQIDILEPGLMVIAEQFGDWIDSPRSIDLL